MSYYVDMNDGRGPLPVKNKFLADAIIDNLVKRFNFRYRIRDVSLTIVEKVV